MRQMEIVRLGFRPGTPEAEQALERNTILHRLRLRQGQPAYRFARTAVDGRALLRRVINVDMDSKGRVYVATRQSSVVLNESGGIVSQETANDLRGLAMHGDVPIWFYERHSGRHERSYRLPFPTRTGNVNSDIQAGAVVSGEAMLIADRRTKAVHRVSMSGGYQSRLALIDAVALLLGRWEKLRRSSGRRAPCCL